MTRLPRLFVVLVIGFVVLGAGCGGENPYQAAESSNTAAQSSTVATNTVDSVVENVFLPEDQNVTDCVGTLERPDCGSKSKGGWRTYLTFAVLIAGMSFIGWRITIGIRQRDAVVNRDVDKNANGDADVDHPVSPGPGA